MILQKCQQCGHELGRKWFHESNHQPPYRRKSVCMVCEGRVKAEIAHSEPGLAFFRITPGYMLIGGAMLCSFPWAKDGRDLAREIRRDRDDYRNGWTLDRLAMRRGCSRNGIYRLMHALGEIRQHGGAQPSHEVRNRAKRARKMQGGYAQ